MQPLGCDSSHELTLKLLHSLAGLCCLVNNPFCRQRHLDLSFRVDRKLASHQAKHGRFLVGKAAKPSRLEEVFNLPMLYQT